MSYRHSHSLTFQKFSADIRRKLGNDEQRNSVKEMEHKPFFVISSFDKSRSKFFKEPENSNVVLTCRKSVMRQRPEPLPHFISNNLSISDPLFHHEDIFEDGQISISTFLDAALCTPPPPPTTVMPSLLFTRFSPS